MLPKNIQILLFSATFPEKVLKYATSFAPSANIIKLRVQELTVKGISQMYMDCPGEADKYEILCKLYGLMNIGSSIIFVKVCDDNMLNIQRMLMILDSRQRNPDSTEYGSRRPQGVGPAWSVRG